ncbi:hypothetical protein SPRG_11727 [Saprolegnia parasitica CBS 223.65]|uniref:BCNT-C domain-containing protein n=1 Tax=Saprolegnia parasitica (strain CBS 223.65) TaxID=695850 RepID=A0A067C0A0_SAPPC|nr:hypothetical protein SPRG_11727 [Saprolegnia parasitica CBS 223.65]KDO22545.1 hypothetical protein SPRG_11727 [Saprolegnia parasitica CBS 223.65]|eukprot:XP_012206791.1 hypothetical protein SPRG_11727 [Saprolegnia parasitica CBS 223.65]
MSTEPKATKDPIDADADAEDLDDEDYNPEQDTEAKVEDELDAKEEQEFLRKHAAKQPEATGASKRKVDDLWADLNADTAVSAASTSKTAKLLHKLVQGPPKKKKTKTVHDFHMPIMGCSGKSRGDAPLKQAAAATHVLKFAGQEYTVKKTAVKKTGLDAVVDALQEPKKVSTIEKSSLDWDSFKEKEGIVDELEQYTKDGYLEKKDFLHRVDLRKFELEKAEREKVRRAQANS